MAIRLVLIFVLGTVLRAHAEGPPFEEYQVKAAFLYNFAKFVEWPQEAFKDSNDRISICVLGKNPFGSSLTDAVQGKTVGTRKFAVSVLSNAADARACHILFVVAP